MSSDHPADNDTLPVHQEAFGNARRLVDLLADLRDIDAR